MKSNPEHDCARPECESVTGVGRENPNYITAHNDNSKLAIAESGISRSLGVATARLNDAIHDHVVTLAARNGSTTSPAVRYVHFANATARVIGLPKSDAEVVAAMPTEERAALALIRAGVAARIPRWAAEVEIEGGAKPHNRILGRAKVWANLEVKALRAVGFEDVIAQAEALLALKVTP
jgi:hypothetical protein